MQRRFEIKIEAKLVTAPAQRPGFCDGCYLAKDIFINASCRNSFPEHLRKGPLLCTEENFIWVEEKDL